MSVAPFCSTCPGLNCSRVLGVNPLFLFAVTKPCTCDYAFVLPKLIPTSCLYSAFSGNIFMILCSFCMFAGILSSSQYFKCILICERQALDTLLPVLSVLLCCRYWLPLFGWKVSLRNIHVKTKFPDSQSSLATCASGQTSGVQCNGDLETPGQCPQQDLKRSFI